MEVEQMKFFVDTANVEDIKKANDLGVICGVTTNPSLIAKEGRDFTEVIKEITSIVDGPISGEVKATTTDAEGMIKEGREIAAIHPNMVVKIPMTVEGLKAVKVLSKEGIKTNVTLIFSANQAILAANAGATYVSPFIGRLDDINQPGVDLIRQIAEIFGQYPDLFPPIVVQMIQVGEQTGRVEFALRKVAEFYIKETDNIVKNFSSLIEPVLMVFLAIGVGLLVSAVLLPIYQVATSIQ